MKVNVEKETKVVFDGRVIMLPPGETEVDETNKDLMEALKVQGIIDGDAHTHENGETHSHADIPPAAPEEPPTAPTTE